MIVLPLVYCSVDDALFKVSPEIAVQVCQVATVVMETMQLVLSQFENFLYENYIRSLSSKNN